MAGPRYRYAHDAIAGEPATVALLFQHSAGVRHAKLMVACGCKSHPVKAVAGRLGSSSCGRRGDARSEV